MGEGLGVKIREFIELISQNKFDLSGTIYLEGMGRVKIPMKRIENPNSRQNIPAHVNDKKLQKSWRLEQEYNFLLRELDAEKKRNENLKRLETNNKADSWCRRDIECLQLHQVREFSDSLNRFKERIIQVLQEKQPMKLSNKVLDEIEAEQMVQRQSYQPAIWGEQLDFSTQSIMGSCSNNEGMPSHLLIPHEGCLEMSELQRVVMPADNQHLQSDHNEGDF
ncbi:hypothetical protein SUGI_0436040 [Cryptomeria japonica]|nr:hypothetical protein SUGI_0436040 [Cryptomeria japonica]